MQRLDRILTAAGAFAEPHKLALLNQEEKQKNASFYTFYGSVCVSVHGNVSLILSGSFALLQITDREANA